MPAKLILRQAHLEVFPFSPVTMEEKRTAVLFQYLHTDLLGNADYEIIELEEFAV